MKVLFNQGTPARLRDGLVGHIVETAHRGWSSLSNGDLLARAENGSSNLFITTDQNLKHQEDLSCRQLAIIVLPTTRWPEIQRHMAQVVEAVASITRANTAR
jgi:hypothetical protein